MGKTQQVDAGLVAETLVESLAELADQARAIAVYLDQLARVAAVASMQRQELEGRLLVSGKTEHLNK